MKVLIAGGDGYLGWPTAMNLSAHGHEVLVADNYLRRRMSLEEDVEPLFEVPNLNESQPYRHIQSGADKQDNRYGSPEDVVGFIDKVREKFHFSLMQKIYQIYDQIFPASYQKNIGNVNKRRSDPEIPSLDTIE